MKKIFPVYFTCAGHFAELEVSVKSLVLVGSKHIGRIYIYCDLQDFFTSDQICSLSEICPNIVFRKTKHPMAWGGDKVVENELLGFCEIGNGIGDDYLMNIDADLIFISDKILDFVAHNNSDLIGNPCDVVFEVNKIRSGACHFQQGSCYFVKGGFAKKMLAYYTEHRTEIVDSVNKRTLLPVLPADVAINEIAGKINAVIQYVNFFVTDDRSVVHLELSKDKRWENFGKLLGIKNYGRHKTNAVP